MGNHVSEQLTLVEVCEVERSPRIQLLFDVSDKIVYEGEEQHTRLAKLVKTTHAMHQQTERVFSLAVGATTIAEHAQGEGYLATLRQLLGKADLSGSTARRRPTLYCST